MGMSHIADSRTLSYAITLRSGGGLTFDSDGSLTFPTCTSGQIMKFDGTNWNCGADDDTTYSAFASGGLRFSGTQIGLQNCPVGQFLVSTGTNTWDCTGTTDANTITYIKHMRVNNWTCKNDSGGVPRWFVSVNFSPSIPSGATYMGAWAIDVTGNSTVSGSTPVGPEQVFNISLPNNATNPTSIEMMSTSIRTPTTTCTVNATYANSVDLFWAYSL